MLVQVIVRVIYLKSDSSSCACLCILFNGTELDLGGTMGVETGMALVQSLLVFSSFEGNPSSQHIFAFISCSIHNLSFSCLFPDAICVLSLGLYVVMSYRDY